MTATTEPGVAAAAATGTKRCGECDLDMMRLEISTRLSAHLPGDTPEAYWTATPLDGWTCPQCGKTALYARNPAVFRT